MPHEYGLTAACQNKIALKRDAESEKAALMWIFGILGEPAPDDAIENVLRDGQVLCRFIKKVRPDLLPGNINSGSVDAKLRENVGNFINACTKLGVRGTDIFQTNDLYDKKDIGQVMVTLGALGTQLQTANPDLPTYGPAPKHG